MLLTGLEQLSADIESAQFVLRFIEKGHQLLALLRKLAHVIVSAVDGDTRVLAGLHPCCLRRLPMFAPMLAFVR